MKSTYTKLFSILSMGIAFFILILSPPKRIVLSDGFSSLAFGELLNQGSCSVPVRDFSQFKLNLRTLFASRESVRIEEVPLPPGSVEQKQIFRNQISLEEVPVNRSMDRIYYSQAANLNIVYSIYYALGLENWYTLLFLAPLFFLLVKLLPAVITTKGRYYFSLFFLFNPLLLFYCYHSSSIDCANLILISLFLVMGLRWQISQKIETGSVLGNFELKHSILLGILSATLILGNPANILVILFFFLVNLFDLPQKTGHWRWNFVVVFGTHLICLLVWLVVSYLCGFPLTAVLLEHPLWADLAAAAPFHWASCATLVARNVYLLARASLLAFPILLPALFGVLFAIRKKDETTSYLIGCGLLLVLPTVFGPNLDCAHYLLTGRLLLPLLPILSIFSSLWLTTRPRAERNVYLAFSMLVGISGYVFFLARMRIDFLNLGIMDALDKNFRRMYLVFQYSDLFQP